VFEKHVVDDDIDVHDPGDVECAIAARVQGDQDLVVMPGLRGRSIDPSLKPGQFTTKIGVDATVPMSQRQRFKRIGVPNKIKESVAKQLAKIKN
jgi:3-polyprenyl-4-hydroxybenzoate decarboxylase